MAQTVINCPKCDKQHEVAVFRNGGNANHIASIGIQGCSFETSDRLEIMKLLGIEETHKQRIKWQEMPSRDY